MGKKNGELANIILGIPVNSSIAIFPHIGVDSDCLGSTLALKLALDQLGLRARVITNEPVPEKFDFFPGIGEILVYSPQQKAEAFISHSFLSDVLDYGILVDCSSPSRIGECDQIYLKTEQKMVFDHHFTSTCVEELCLIDNLACASGEIIFNLISIMEKKTGKSILTIDIATCLMAAIMADTGGFRYANTNRQAFGIAYNLFSRFPLDIRALTYHLFEKTSISRVRLQGKAYEALQLHADNRIAICLITQAMIEECNAMEGDVDGICNDLKNIDGVIVAFVLRERANGEIRVNIRSSEKFDASYFAALYGGGGHMRASGFTLTDMALEEAHQVIVKKTMEIFHDTMGNPG